MGQAHGVEQHLAQLLGAVGVEAGAAGLHVDAGQHLFQLGAHPHAELLDAVPVRQHLRQRELNVVVQGILAAGGDLGFHFGKQVGQTSGVRVVGAGEGRSGLVAGHQLSHLILGRRGIQQVGSQLAVPDDAAAPAACGHGSGVQGSRIEHIQRDVGIVQQTEQVGVLQRVDGGVLHGVPAFRLQHHVAAALLASDGRASGHQVVAGRGKGQGGKLCLRQLRGLLFRGGLRGHTVQPEARDQRVDLQLLQQAHGGGLVALAHGVAALGRVDGRIGADGAQRVAQLGHGLVL